MPLHISRGDLDIVLDLSLARAGMEVPGVSLARRGVGRPCHGMGCGCHAQADRLDLDISISRTMKLILTLGMYTRRRRQSHEHKQANAQNDPILLMLEMQYGCWGEVGWR